MKIKKKGVLIMMAALISANLAGASWPLHIIDGDNLGADGVKIADINNDGFMDIATGWEEDNITRVCVNPGYETANDSWDCLTIGASIDVEDALFIDLDSDGDYDVVSSTEGTEQKIYFYWYEGNNITNASYWTRELLPASDNGYNWMYTEPFEFNNSGCVDLVSGSKDGGKLVWFECPADPTVVADWVLHDISDIVWTMSIIVTDMDGDGTNDTLLSDRGGLQVVWKENPTWVNHSVGQYDGDAMFLDQGDIDGDTDLDIVAAVQDRIVSILDRQDATGDSWIQTNITIPKTFGTMKATAIGDMDGDGDADIVFTCEVSNFDKRGVGWLEQSGGDWILHNVGNYVGEKYDRVELLDLDGDGDLDILTTEEKELGVIWYENDEPNTEVLGNVNILGNVKFT